MMKGSSRLRSKETVQGKERSKVEKIDRKDSVLSLDRKQRVSELGELSQEVRQTRKMERGRTKVWRELIPETRCGLAEGVIGEFKRRDRRVKKCEV